MNFINLLIVYVGFVYFVINLTHNVDLNLDYHNII